jgi:6-phosphogluconolactonase
MKQLEMKQPILVQIWKNRNDLEYSVVQKIYEVIRKTLKDKPQCCIVLSGGETPRNVYHRMGLDEINKEIDWNRVQVFFSDERAVPPDDLQSNYGMIWHEWISHIPIPRSHVHRIQGELHPQSAAQKYEQEIIKVFEPHPIVFDLILLGVGRDGHTASLFPGMNAVLEQKALATSEFVELIKSWRVTLTFPILNAAREVIFLVAGKEKAAIIQHVLEKEVPDIKLPASLIRPKGGTLCWMIDDEAGVELKEHSSMIIQRLERH